MIEYQIDSMSTPLDEFISNEDKSYKYIFDMSTHIDMDSVDILKEFFKRVMTSPDKMCISSVDCAYGEASRNYRFRYMIFKTEDDYVLVPLKVIDPRSAEIKNYYTISYPPISLNNKSIRKVIDALKLYPSIKTIEVFCSEDENTRNNYYNLPRDFSNMDRAKWKSKRGINKLNKIITVDYHSELYPDIFEKHKSIFDIWCSFRGKKPTIRTDKGMIELARKDENACVITFWYKDKLLGITVGIPIFDDYITIYTQKSLGVCDIEFLKEYLEEDDDSIVEDIRKYLGSYVQYCINKYCFIDKGVKAVYYTGDQGDSNLRNFKKIYYKNAVYFKRIPLDEYVEEE